MKEETKEKLDIIKDLATNSTRDVLEILSEFFLTGISATIVGSVAPGVISAILTYQ